jgi:2-iminobutanoate/2-iminopropanoate deaminase
MYPEPVASAQAPAAVGPYSQAIKHGGLVFISGQLPLNPKTGKFISDDIRDQARQCLTNLNAVARAAGSGLEKAVKLSIFVTDIKDFPAVNEVYGTFFEEPYPARSTVQVAALPLGAKIEIDAIVIV